jgi:3-hydroxyisobutyrate dehydrogenase
MQIGFLGLGAMGSRMASRLIAAGHQVSVWNRSPEPARGLLSKGAQLAATPAAAASGAEIVISVVRDDDASRAVWDQPLTGALATLAAGAIAVESSTLTVARVRYLAAAMSAAGRAFIDAPVVGSRQPAESGTLIFLAGGPLAVVERIRPVLLAMGSAVHHVGETAGAGMAMKLMVNALYAEQVAALAEIMSLGERYGIPLQRSAEILSELPATSPAARGAAALIAARSFAPQFPIGLVEKDIANLMAAAKSVAADAPIAQALHALLARAVADGFASDNITGLLQLYR